MTAETLAGFLIAAGYSHKSGSNAVLSDSLEWIFALESTRPFVDWLSDKLLQEPGLSFTLDKSPGHTVHYNGLEILSEEESNYLKTHRRMDDSLVSCAHSRFVFGHPS